jgi:flagellar hook-length control protein FliK
MFSDRVRHTVVASSTTATSSSQAARAGDATQRNRSSREGGATSAFAEALDEQQRALGEAEQDSRVARSRNQRRPNAQPETISTTADSAVSRRLADDKPVIDDDKMAEATADKDRPVEPVVTAGAGADAKPAEPAATSVVEQTVVAQPETAPVAPPTEAVPQADAPIVPIVAEAAVDPQAAPVPVPVPAAAAAAPAPPAVDTPAAEAQAANAPAIAAVAAPVTDKQAAPAEAAPAPIAEPGKVAAEQPAARVQAAPEAKVEARAEAKVEMRPETRAEQPAPPPAAPAQTAAADTAPASAPQLPAPSPVGPLSFASEVAQKVAAQTQAAGSVVPVHALAVTIAARASTGSTRFDIKLDPPELGRIEVQMTLDREGRVKSKMVVEKQETLELLQRDQRNLERTLAQAGIETSEGGIEFSLKDQGADSRQGDRQGRTWQAVVEDPDATATLAANAATYSRLAAARGGIDIRI